MTTNSPRGVGEGSTTASAPAAQPYGNYHPQAMQPAPGQPAGQPYMGQPQQPYMGQPQQPYMGQPQQPYMGQPYMPYPQQPGYGQPPPMTTMPPPGQTYPQQPMMGQPYPGQPYGQPMMMPPPGQTTVVVVQPNAQWQYVRQRWRLMIAFFFMGLALLFVIISVTGPNVPWTLVENFGADIKLGLLEYKQNGISAKYSDSSNKDLVDKCDAPGKAVLAMNILAILLITAAHFTLCQFARTGDQNTGGFYVGVSMCAVVLMVVSLIVWGSTCHRFVDDFFPSNTVVLSSGWSLTLVAIIFTIFVTFIARYFQSPY